MRAGRCFCVQCFSILSFTRRTGETLRPAFLFISCNVKRITVYISVLVTALAAGFLFSPAMADVFIPEYGPGKKVSLNGQWKYSTKNLPDTEMPDFDDSAWQSVNVPGEWREQGITGTNVVWYRHTFEPESGKKYSWLRFERVLDEAEVWLNGRKLEFPVFQPPLESTQYGVFQRVWMMDWPNAYSVNGIIEPGAVNTIAVRVVNDPETRSHYIGAHDSPPFRGAAGITGDVYLISHPPVFIDMIERLSSFEIWNGLIEHRFFVMTGNTTEDVARCTLSVKIFGMDGGAAYSETKEVDVPPGGEITDFQWRTAPEFERYSAVISIKTSSGYRDTAALRFHGTHVVATGEGLVLNAGRFVIKGAEGIPGARTVPGGDGLLSLKRGDIAGRLARLRDLGVNTVRLPESAPDIMAETAEMNMMVIPVLSNDWAKTVLALREYPNILYWEISGNSKAEILEMGKVIRALDHYRRPLAYSGPLDIGPADLSYGGMNLYVEDAASVSTRDCEAGAPLNDEGKPVVFIGWGENRTGGGGTAWRTLKSMADFWDECVASGYSGGAVYHSLDELAGDGAAADPWADVFSEYVAGHFSDFHARLDTSASGRTSLKLELVTENTIYDIVTYAGGTAQGNIIARRNRLSPGGALRIDLVNEQLLASDFFITYKSHGGMENTFPVSPAKPVLSPADFFFTNEWSSFKSGIPSAIKLRVTGDGLPRSARVSLVSDNPDVRIDPAARGVSIPAYDYVDLPFTVTCPEPGVRAAIHATLRFTGGPGLPLKAHLPVEFR